ncbi:MAG TPA: PH domain-containing protein [Thermoanaerobaculia bacterium]
MGILNGLLGNASQVDIAEIQQELSRVLLPDEQIHRAYKIIRDSFVFSSTRLILIDRQGLTGKKVSYMSIPYKSIRMFSVETAGTFDLDAELKIWIAGMAAPIAKQFRKGDAIFEVQVALAHYVAQA